VTIFGSRRMYDIYAGLLSFLIAFLS